MRWKSSSTLLPSSSMPAACRMLRLRSRSRLACWAGFSSTAAVDTTTEQTIHSEKATVMIFLMLSLLDTGNPPLDIALHDKMIHEWCKQIRKQDSQHHAFGESRVDDPDDDHHHADQHPECPASNAGHGRRHGVCCHEKHTERKAAEHKMPVPGHVERGIAVRTHEIEEG